MTLVGVDLNTTDARAVQGPEGSLPRALELDGEAGDLPMIVSLERQSPEMGRAGRSICREFPHLVCEDYLAHIGSKRSWAAGRHRFDASKLVSLFFNRLRSIASDVKTVAVAVPAYLSRSQTITLGLLAQKARLPIAHFITSPLALAISGHVEEPWTGMALVLDADDHAMTWAVVKAAQAQAQMVACKSMPQLNVRVWKEALIDGISVRCVHQSRHDPRDSGMAEQMLYDQFEDVMEAGLHDQLIEVVIQTTQWSQNLILQSREIRGFCSILAKDAFDEIGAALAAASPGHLGAILVTGAARRLPGLLAMVQEGAGDRVPIVMLDQEAAARGAHDVASRGRRGELSLGHIDVAIPLSQNTHSSPIIRPAQRVIPISAAER